MNKHLLKGAKPVDYDGPDGGEGSSHSGPQEASLNVPGTAQLTA